MEMTSTKMVLCKSYCAYDHIGDRLLSIGLFEQEVHDEQSRQTLNTTGSLDHKGEDDALGLGYPTDNVYRLIDVLIDELGNIFANVKELGIHI